MSELKPFVAGLARRMRSRGLLAEMVERHGCGFFDGGCLLLARAAARLLGAEVSVVIGAGLEAEHAVVLHGGFVLDGFGATPVGRYPAKLVRQEGLRMVGFRLWRPADLTEAVADVEGLAWLTARLVGVGSDLPLSER